MIAAVKPFVDRLYNRPIVLLVIVALSWATNAIAGQLARGEITPMQHTLLRWIFITAMMWPIYGRQALDCMPVIRRHWALVAAMSVLGYTGFNILYYLASFNTVALNVGILQGSVPVFVALAAYLIRGTRITTVQAIGVLVTLAGVVVVATRGAPWLVLGIAFNLGDMFMLMACASYSAFAVLLQGRPAMPGAVFFTVMSPIAAVTAIPPVLLEAATSDVAWPTMKGTLITAYVALIPGVVAQQFFMRGVDLIGPSQSGMFINLVPVFAAIMAVLVLGETFAVYHGVALALVLGGIALVQLIGRS